MKVLMAQMNPTVGDFDGNVAGHKAVMDDHGKKADLIVFGELSLCGYFPNDMLGMKGFIEAHNEALEQVIQHSLTCEAGIVIGCVRENPGTGRRFYNTLALIERGNVLSLYHKHLLPDYNIFNESRWFEPGHQIENCFYRGEWLAFLICEDIWLDHDDPVYKSDPVGLLALEQVDIVISIHGSPGNMHKPRERLEAIERTANRIDAAVVYVNQVGGHDDIVFDGGSLVVNAQGGLLGQLPFYETGCLLVDTASQAIVTASDPGTLDILYHQTCLGLKDYMWRSGFTKVIVGSSGGIDSALTIALAASAIGPENVIAVTMPSQFSSSGSVDDSQALCNNLGINLITDSVAAEFDLACARFEVAHGFPMSALAMENQQARIRGMKLMALSNTNGAMLLTTGNKSEAAVGYYTLYGDSCGGLNLLGDMYKSTEVYPLSAWLNMRSTKDIIPWSIIEKPPSAELSEDQVDADSLPPYEDLDKILKLYIEYDALPASAIDTLEREVGEMDQGVVAGVKSLVNMSEHKRKQAAMIIRVQRISFGSGRRVPVAGVYNWGSQ